MQHKAVYLLFCKFTLHVWSGNHIPLQRGQGLATLEVAAQKIWPVPEAVVTVLCTPDDGCVWHPKCVQWTCRIINRLLCVASRWTIIDKGPVTFTKNRFWISYQICQTRN